MIACFVDHPIHPPLRIGKPYNEPIPPSSEHVFRLVHGNYEVFSSAASMENGDKPLHFGIRREQFWRDYSTIWYMMLDGPL